MKREEFVNTATNLVAVYLSSANSLPTDDYRLRVNPQNLNMMIVDSSDFLNEIADNDEAIEDAAAAERSANKDFTDFQASMNPDFYPLRTLVKKNPDGSRVVDAKAVDAIADIYF